MPKKVDHTERKEQIAAAVWRVILKHGIDKASIQQIAEEANISVGLVQHHFVAKDELIYYAMKLVLDRMGERARARTSAFTGSNEEAVRRLMRFIIPMNNEEVMEAKVWLSFLGKSFSNPELHTLQQEMDNYTRHLMGMILSLMEELGYLTAESNREFELELLYGFLDGLVIHVLQSPEHYSEDRVDQLIDYYLATKKGAGSHA